MREVTALVSHCVRNKKDVDAIRRILQLAWSKNRRNGDKLHLMAPYVLHAATLDTDQLLQYRIHCASGVIRSGAVVHEQLHLHGNVLCEAMQADIHCAQERKIPIKAMTAKMEVLLQKLLKQTVLVAAE